MSERQCGSCSLCCKILPIPDLQKTAGPWCTHCRSGEGCGIYAVRPEACRDFHCGWLKIPALGEELRPDRCHFLVRMDQQPQTVRFDVDPDYPDTAESSALVNLRRGLNGQGFTIIVNLGTGGTVHLPDGTMRPLIVADSVEEAEMEVARHGLEPGTYYVQLP